MRRLLAGIGLAAGLAWLLGRRRRPAQAAPAADPAEELKQKLAESRGFAEEPVPAPPEPSLDERRQDVHERARASIERMRETDQPPTAESQ
jgi:enoyl-CoA hydratase/carnithine racemase